MSLNLIAFCIGLFGVPVVPLLLGHRLRWRSSRTRRIFWGGLTGYCIAGTLAVIGMIPPEAWESREVTRGLIGFWGMVVLPALGALGAGFVRSSRS